MKQIRLITDGACLGNPGPGGWAALLRWNHHERMLTGSEPQTTNNRMELLAVIQGLDAILEPVTVEIVTDSKYVHDAMTQGWVEKWQSNGWKTSNKGAVANQDLWERLITSTQRHQVRWTWVRGHSGDPDNEAVDKAARDAAAEEKRAQSPITDPHTPDS